MTHKKNILVLIVGKSGSGKDTLVNYLCECNTDQLTIRNSSLNILDEYFNYFTPDFKQVISYTTRPRRNQEKNTHIFTDTPPNNPLTNNEIIGWTKYHHYEYWATKEQLNNADFYIIDTKGVDILLQKKYNNKTVIVIYLKTHWWVRFSRVAKRNNITYAIKRLWNDYKSFKNINRFNPIILKNNNLNDLKHNISNIISIFYPNSYAIWIAHTKKGE